jgi:hypothetical protein
MRKLGLYILVGSSLALLSAHALGGNLEGLEMDVMDANEAPDDAVSRITLPGADPAIGGSKPEDAGLITDSARQSGRAAGASDARAPELAIESAGEATDAGEPAVPAGQPVDLGDSTDVDAGGTVEANPTDPAAIDGEPGDVGIIEPSGTVDDLPIEEPPPAEEPPPTEEPPLAEPPPVEEPPLAEPPPVEEPPLAEPPPVEEPPSGLPPVEPPLEEVPIGEDPGGGVQPGDEGGSSGASGSEGKIEPLPVETSAESELDATRHR